MVNTEHSGIQSNFGVGFLIEPSYTKHITGHPNVSDTPTQDSTREYVRLRPAVMTQSGGPTQCRAAAGGK